MKRGCCFTDEVERKMQRETPADDIDANFKCYSFVCGDCCQCPERLRKNKRKLTENCGQFATINDLASELLMQIFRHLAPSFWFERLRFVCTMWHKTVDRMCSSVHSLEFDSAWRDCHLLVTGIPSGISHKLCSSDALRYYAEKAGPNMKKLTIRLLRTPPKSPARFLEAIGNCKNLTHLALECDLSAHVDQLGAFSLSNLQSLTLVAESLKDPTKMRALLIKLLSKSRQISELSVTGIQPDVMLFGWLRNFPPKLLHVGLPSADPSSCFGLLAAVAEFAHSLESLSLCHRWHNYVSSTTFLANLLQLSLADNLTSLRWHFGTSPPTFLSHEWSEVVIFGLCGLSKLNQLTLSRVDFTFNSTLQQNRRHLMAGQLMAAMVGGLTILDLTFCRCDDAFLQQTFSGGLPNLKKLHFSPDNISPRIIYLIVGSWCLNLQTLGLLPNEKSTGKEGFFPKENFLTNLHKTVHNCEASSGNSIIGRKSGKNLVVLQYLTFLCKFESLNLCGVRMDGKNFLIGRTCF